MALVGVALCAATVLVAITLARSGASGSPGITGDRLVPIDSAGRAASPVISLPDAPASMTVAAGSVWAADSPAQSVLRISPASGSVVDRIPVAGQPGSLALGGGAVWVSSTLGGTIERIDPRTDGVTQTVRLGSDDIAAITFGRGALWVADTTRRAVAEIDPRTGSVRRILAVDVRPTAIAVGPRAIWLADYAAATVEELDPRSGAVVATIHTGNGPSALAASQGGVWVANNLDSTVSRISARTGALVTTVATGSGPIGIALDAGSVWVAGTYAAQLTRIDPHTNRIVRRSTVGGRPSALAAGLGRVWVGTAATSSKHRGGTLRMVSTTSIHTTDPAFANLAEPFQLPRLAYDSLLTFEAAPGPSGLRLVPDLATTIPAPIAGGTVYPFRLRGGIRYSDGRIVRPEDFRRGIERLFRLHSPGAAYYDGLLGARACRLRPAACSLRRGITAGARTRTVAFHLRAPDPDFPYKLTAYAYSAPIPPGTPDRGALVPGSGPYRISATGERVELVRNRFFHEWSHAAQPDGYPDRIEWSAAASSAAAARDVRAGRADWMFGLLPPAGVSRLRVERTAQLHEDPSTLLDFIPVNTHRAPFDDVRVRRALSYGLDRRRIARLYGTATPTCQTLMAGMLGYHPDCHHLSPDRARARRLVAASGTRGQRIDVWGASDNLGVPREVPAYVSAVLRSLGYRVRLHMVPFAQLTAARRRRIQISVDGDWLPDYPAPSSYVPQFLGCRGGLSNGYVCDPALDKRMRAAASLELSNPSRAASAWAAIDRYITRRADWIPTVLPREPELVSQRVGNYEYSPIWGFIADQAWVR
jgi:ABC-type transport system substrate-binding protein